MKKLVTIVLLSGVIFISAQSASAQAQRQLNFGLIAISYDIPVAADIAVAPFAATNFNYLTVGVRANYYFDDLIGLPEAWDVYGGASAGLGIDMINVNNNINNGNGLDIGLQVGGRWFWSEKWGVYLEAGGGFFSGQTGSVGLTMKM